MSDQFLINEIKKLEKELKEIKEANRWRDETLEQPEDDRNVLIYHKELDLFIEAYYESEQATWYQAHDHCIMHHLVISHWMPIPELKESGVDHEL